MQMQEQESLREKTGGSALLGSIVGLIMVPILFVGACLALPVGFVLRWRQRHREDAFRSLMKARGRSIQWPELLRRIEDSGGTCIEEKFSSKGPIRLWWTAEDVRQESPHEIIDWFTMRKGRRFAPFILWCRERYTGAEAGAAVLVETWGVSKQEIYALWAQCRSETRKGQWIEVAPPEILARGAGQSSARVG